MDCEWDSGDDDKEMQQKEWKRVENNLEKTGYKEGMESSQDDTLQDGFNQSFKQAVSMAFVAGRLQGAICASVGGNLVTEGQDSNKSSDSLGNLNNSISSHLSEIPDILTSTQTGGCQACTCSRRSDGDTNISKGAVGDYWANLQKIQTEAEKADKYLDSSFISHE